MRRFSPNRKVINATPTSLNGITFRSKSEMKMYMLLVESGLHFEYEPEPIVLLDGFYTTHSWYEGTKEHNEKVRSMTYTPDFVVYGTNKQWFIEVKGMVTDRYPLKRKMMLKYINDKNIAFFEVHTVKDMNFCIEKIKEHEIF